VAAGHAARPAAPPAEVPAQLPPDPILDSPRAHTPRHALPPEQAPVMSPADVAAGRPGWPCQTCGAVVSLDTESCPACGSAFLAAAKEKVGVRLPLLGEITRLGTGARVALMGAGAMVITVVFVVCLMLLAAIF
jgi:hypothetical protein